MEDSDCLDQKKWQEYQKGCGIKKKVKKSKNEYTCPNIPEDSNECCIERCPMWKEW